MKDPLKQPVIDGNADSAGMAVERAKELAG
jgi:hypothetical protein